MVGSVDQMWFLVMLARSVATTGNGLFATLCSENQNQINIAMTGLKWASIANGKIITICIISSTNYVCFMIYGSITVSISIHSLNISLKCTLQRKQPDVNFAFPRRQSSRSHAGPDTEGTGAEEA